MIWTDPGWLAEARSWIDAQLDRHCIELTGEIEQPHVRPWATVLRLPSSAGNLWFKANHPSLAHEAGVVALISRRRPDLVPELLAADLERGWMLMSDGGERLREVITRERDLSRWLELLPQYAELQIDLAADADGLVVLGAPDRRLAALPDQFEALGRSPEHGPLVHDWCERLGAYRIPETIQHDDFHDGQIFVRDGRYLFFDWGDACVSHPFLTLAVTLRFAAAATKQAVHYPPIVALRDAYLEPWSDRASTQELREAAELGRRIGEVSRTLTFYAVARAYPGVLDSYPGGFAGSLRRVLGEFS